MVLVDPNYKMKGLRNFTTFTDKMDISLPSFANLISFCAWDADLIVWVAKPWSWCPGRRGNPASSSTPSTCHWLGWGSCAPRTPPWGLSCSSSWTTIPHCHSRGSSFLLAGGEMVSECCREVKWVVGLGHFLFECVYFVDFEYNWYFIYNNKYVVLVRRLNGEFVSVTDHIVSCFLPHLLGKWF